MDKQRADDLIKSLKDIFFYVTVVESAPAVSNFSTIQGSILYGTPPGKVSAQSLFNVSSEVLMGGGNPDERSATRRLMAVLDDTKSIKALKTSIEETETERMQFLILVDMLLRKLTPIIHVNRLSYADSTLRDCDVHQDIQPAYLGMGNKRTWHGTPDGRADWAPLKFKRRKATKNDNDSESEQTNGGKTTCEAKKSFDPDDHRSTCGSGGCVIFHPPKPA